MNKYTIINLVPSHSSAFPPWSLGVHVFGETASVCDHFLPTHRDSLILALWMVHAEYVFIAGIHPLKTQMSVPRKLECMHAQTRPQFILSSKIAEGSTRAKSPQPDSSKQGETCDTTSCRMVILAHYQLRYFGPYSSIRC